MNTKEIVAHLGTMVIPQVYVFAGYGGGGQELGSSLQKRVSHTYALRLG